MVFSGLSWGNLSVPKHYVYWYLVICREGL
jgi:hypothetical protein